MLLCAGTPSRLLVLTLFLAHSSRVATFRAPPDQNKKDSSKVRLLPSSRCKEPPKDLPETFRGDTFYPKQVLGELWGTYGSIGAAPAEWSGKCHTLLQTLLGCTRDLDYTLHALDRAPFPRSSWISCDFLRKPVEIEAVRGQVNSLLPGLVAEYLEGYKESERFAARLDQDVEAMMEEFVAGNLREDLQEMERESREQVRAASEHVEQAQTQLVAEILGLVREAGRRELDRESEYDGFSTSASLKDAPTFWPTFLAAEGTTDYFDEYKYHLLKTEPFYDWRTDLGLVDMDGEAKHIEFGEHYNSPPFTDLIRYGDMFAGGQEAEDVAGGQEESPKKSSRFGWNMG